MNDKVSVQVVTFGAMNFAMQQNYVPLVRSVTFTHRIEVLPPHTEIEVSPVNIIVSTEFLFSLTERIVAQISVQLLCGEEELVNAGDNIDLLAYDEWSGCYIMPELIAAFVTPNHPAISGILKIATGYQSRNADVVKLQMAAVYAALQSKNIVYNNPPASFEKAGQRVRLPYSVIEQKQGTCIDLAVTYASCLEAAGLFPLIMIKKGHAYCGCRLEEETFADCVIDDFSAIDKRTVSGNEDILLVECTDFTA